MIPVIIFFIRIGVTAKEEEKPGLLALLPIYVAGGAFFMILHLNGSAMTQWARDDTDRESKGAAKALTAVLPSVQQEGLPRYYLNAAEDVPRPHPDSLLVAPSDQIARMFGQERMDEPAVAAVDAIEGIRAVEISDGSPEEWVARAVDVYADDVVKVEEIRDSHGVPTIAVSLPDGARPEREVAFLRDVAGDKIPVFIVDQHTWDDVYVSYRERFGKEPEYLPRGQFLTVINPEVYQSWNPFFVIVLTPLVVAFFQWKVARRKGVPTAHKLVWGMVLTTGALLVMALAGLMTDGGTQKVSGMWLASFFMIVTFGELCLSPMGLSLVTKLSPKRLVGLTMGGWFMAVAFGNNFSGFFGGIQHLMSPVAFFLVLAGLSGLVALFVLAVLPKLDRAITKYGA
jgi:dipeptide/tripeptide permease